MILGGFVNHGADESLLKSMNAQEVEAAGVDLTKAIDKTKLVQVQTTVNGKHGQYTRMQWKNPSDVDPKKDRVVGGNTDATDKDTKSDKTVDGNNKTSAPAETNQNSSNSAAKVPAAKTVSQGSKDKVAAMEKELGGNKQLIQFCKDNGVTWKESDHHGINVMRCKMALSQAIEGGQSFEASKKSDGMSKELTKQSQAIIDKYDSLPDYTMITLSGPDYQEVEKMAEEDGNEWIQDLLEYESISFGTYIIKGEDEMWEDTSGSSNPMGGDKDDLIKYLEKYPVKDDDILTEEKDILPVLVSSAVDLEVLTEEQAQDILEEN